MSEIPRLEDLERIPVKHPGPGIDGEEFFSANLFDVKVHPQLLTLLVPENALEI